MPRKKSEITTTNNSQLSVFDYSGYSEEFKLKSYERKARIKANEQVATKAFYDIAQDVKAQHDEMNNYQDWLTWCDKELGYKRQMAQNFLKIGKELHQHVGVKNLPNTVRGLLAIAESLANVDEETKEKILEEVKEQTEEKGKALTEKEIKEITAPYLEQIQELREQVKEARQGELFFQQKLDEKMSEVNSLINTIDNQNKQIKELNSSISIKEQKLIDLSQKERELEEKESLLAEQKNSLNKSIDDEVNKKLERLKQQELSNIEEQKQRLKDEQKKIQQELRKQKDLAEALENQKQKFNDVRDWLKKIEDFNETIKDRSINIISTIKDIQNLPSFDQLGEDQRKVLFPKFSSVMNDFEKNSEAWGKAINNVYSALTKADREVVNLLNSPIDVEVSE